MSTDVGGVSTPGAVGLPRADAGGRTPASPRGRSRRALWLGGLALAIVAGGGGWWYLHHRAQEAAQAAAPKPPAAVPVTVAIAAARETPLILRGIGSVQAFNSVAIRSKVDGYITEVAFKEGRPVKAGELLVQIDPRPYEAVLEQANGQLVRDQAVLANAQRDLARYAPLVGPGFAPRQTYDTQQALVQQTQAALQSDQATIRAAALNVQYAAIRAPFDGIAGQRQVDLGNLVVASAGVTLVTLTQVQPIFVNFSLPEQTLPDVRRAMAAGTLAVQAFDGNDSKQLAEGRLELVDNQVDPATGTYRLKAQFENKDTALWPGQFVNAHLHWQVVKDGIVVPSSAVQIGPLGRFVRVVKPDSTVAVQPVEVAQVENLAALVTKGLAAGDRVVVDGLGLSSGTKVEVKATRPAPAASPQVPLPGVLDLTGATSPPPGAATGGRLQRETPQSASAPPTQDVQGNLPGTGPPGGEGSGGSQGGGAQ